MTGSNFSAILHGWAGAISRRCRSVTILPALFCPMSRWGSRTPTVWGRGHSTNIAILSGYGRGSAWDQSPTRKSTDRTVRLPDSDRVWLALGLTRRLARKHRLTSDMRMCFSTRRRLTGPRTKIPRFRLSAARSTPQSISFRFNSTINFDLTLE